MELNSPFAAVFAVWDAAELVEYNTNGFFIPLSILVTNQKVKPDLFQNFLRPIACTCGPFSTFRPTRSKDTAQQETTLAI
jgi:hypothetical protein